MEKEKNNCYNCAYRGKVAGSSHSKCHFKWSKSELSPPKANAHGIDKGWYIFPLNYDPVWQQEPCKAHSKEVNPDNFQEFSSLMEFASIVGKRL